MYFTENFAYYEYAQTYVLEKNNTHNLCKIYSNEFNILYRKMCKNKHFTESSVHPINNALKILFADSIRIKGGECLGKNKAKKDEITCILE